MSDQDASHILAKKYSLDLPPYASIELPLNVINDDKAIELMGGKERIQESLVEKHVPLQLRLRPDDPYQHPIHSDVSTSENLLVKVRLPKGEMVKYNNNISKLISANKDSYSFEPVAIINKNFRFRELADFQINTSNNKILQQTAETFYGNDLDNLKKYENLLSQRDQYDTSKPLNLPPFSLFSRVKMPFSYNYTNNKGTTVKNEDGTVRLVNTKRPLKISTAFVPWEDPAPQAPLPKIANLVEEAKRLIEQQISEGITPMNIITNSARYQLVECVKLLENLFEQKPIWLRRHLYTITPTNWRHSFSYALLYVAYSTRTGPWKQSYIKFGVDPKSSSEYALYQTERFRVHMGQKHVEDEDDADMTTNATTSINISRSATPAVDKDAIKELPYDFIFDGTNLPKISTFQLADIKDPELVVLLSKDHIVSKPTARDGWFDPESLVQLRLIMRYKLTCLVSKEPIYLPRVEQVAEMAIGKYRSSLQLKAKDSDDEEDDEDDDDDEDDEAEDAAKIDAVDDVNEDLTEETNQENDLLTRFAKIDPKSLNELKGLLMESDIVDLNIQ